MAVRKKTWLLLSVSNRPLINGNVSLVLECGVKVKNVGKLFLRLFASCAVLPPFFFRHDCYNRQRFPLAHTTCTQPWPAINTFICFPLETK